MYEPGSQDGRSDPTSAATSHPEPTRPETVRVDAAPSVWARPSDPLTPPPAIEWPADMRVASSVTSDTAVPVAPVAPVAPPAGLDDPIASPPAFTAPVQTPYASA